MEQPGAAVTWTADIGGTAPGLVAGITTQVSSLALIVSASVLVVCVVAISASLPGVSVFGRRRAPSARPALPVPLPRRPIAGRRPSLPAGPIDVGNQPPPGAPARQAGPTPDTPEQAPEVRAAERTIERLLEDDPARLAEIISAWIGSDPPSGEGTR
ncbi:hypothetical protein [Ilumatobacter sp.]|uniref:hypothetical protein n=1 Tax=Ilumatobacter sp. TaxID=1967498 RepID=UPI003B523E30